MTIFSQDRRIQESVDLYITNTFDGACAFILSTSAGGSVFGLMHIFLLALYLSGCCFGWRLWLLDVLRGSQHRTPIAIALIATDVCNQANLTPFFRYDCCYTCHWKNNLDGRLAVTTKTASSK